MANSETDLLDIVQLVLPKDVAGLFRRTVSSKDGFSIEVFRGERHLGSIAAKGEALVSNPLKSYESLGVRRDDVIYRVNLGGKLFTREGTFTTSDGLHPSYRAVFELAVINPSQFIIRYRLQDDPVRIALAALEGELRRYVSLRAYNRLRDDELSYRLEHTLNIGNNKAIGLDVVRVHDVVILDDPHVQKKREVIQTKDLERTAVEEDLRTETIKNNFGRTQRERDLDAQLLAQRREDEERLLRERRSEEEKRLKARLDGLAEIAIIEERNQIKDKLSAGQPLQDIWKEHSELGMAFPSSLSLGGGLYLDGQERPELASRTSQQLPESFDDAPLKGQVDVDSTSPRGTSRQKLEVLTLGTLGFTLLPTNLTQGQRASAGFSESRAFLVTMVEDAGLAETAGLAIGDIVVGVNEEIVTDAEILADALRLRDHAGRISLRLLRGKQLISLTLREVD